MTYLEYHKQTKQVVEIHESEPSVANDYDYVKSEQFEIGDEFEWTIWINEVDENKILVSHSAIRNNPNARRLLQENVELKQENERLNNRIKMQELTIEELMFVVLPGLI